MSSAYNQQMQRIAREAYHFFLTRGIVCNRFGTTHTEINGSYVEVFPAGCEMVRIKIKDNWS